jgi:hypothetical protein
LGHLILKEEASQPLIQLTTPIPELVQLPIDHPEGIEDDPRAEEQEDPPSVPQEAPHGLFPPSDFIGQGVRKSRN